MAKSSSIDVTTINHNIHHDTKILKPFFMKILTYFISGFASILITECDSRGDFQKSGSPTSSNQPYLDDLMIHNGEIAYKTYCIGCHGENGDGGGEAAIFLHPRPRNFQTANFKFSSTRAGQLPTDKDLQRTILQGLMGTSMPAYPLLPQKTVDAQIQYIKTFSPKWNEKIPAIMIPYVVDPYQLLEDKSAAIARGEAVYHGYVNCWACHPLQSCRNIDGFLMRKVIQTKKVSPSSPTYSGWAVCMKNTPIFTGNHLLIRYFPIGFEFGQTISNSVVRVDG